VQVGRGGYDIYENGLTWANGLQVGTGLLGLGGNYTTWRRLPGSGPAALGGIAQSARLDVNVETQLLQFVAEDLATYLGKTQSNAQRGPVLTMLRDSVTGEIFFAQNLSAVPDRLHPILEGRLRSYLATHQGKLNPVWGIPASHSEVWALNQALMRREALGLGVQSLNGFAMYNVSLWRSRLGKPVPRCGNCQYLTDGVRVLSGN
jgi:hypothetical protein